MSDGALFSHPQGDDESSNKDHELEEQSEGFINGDGVSTLNWVSFFDELKLQGQLAGSLVINSFLVASIQLISLIFVGHIGELALATSSLAISLANVSGMCIMMGMAGGLETLCGQAFGAKQYQSVGLYLQTGLMILNAVAVGLSFVYIYMGDILVAFGQDKQISYEAGRYARVLIPTLFAQASLQPLIRFLQVQHLVFPMLLFSGMATIGHVLFCWLLVYKTSLGFIGAAVSTSICNWINVILLYAYIMFSPSCSKSRAPLSLQSLKYTYGFCKLAIPSAAMTCLEWWCYEGLVLLSGLLPNPKLQTSSLSACHYLANLIFQIPFGLAATASTRVSTELGAGQPQRAYQSVLVVVTITEVEALIVSVLVLSFHNVLGYIFSSEHEVIEAVAKLLQLLAVSSFLDANQAILSGVARGCGWQLSGALVNLGAFYIVALPVGACLGFLTPLEARGLWIGVICAPLVQIFFLGFMTWIAKWDKEAEKAKQRAQLDDSTRKPLLN